MSYYSVAVFTDEDTSVEDLLEPFDESIEVEKYIALKKEEIIQRGKEKIKYLKMLYKTYMKDKRAYRRQHLKNKDHLRFIKKVPSMAKWDNEKIYKYETRFYDKEEISEDGGIYSTYNPNSKWDWYDIGGRWKNMLIVGKSNDIKDCKYVNSAKVKNIKWDLMKEESQKNMKPYEKYIEESYYPKEYVKEKFPTEQSYINYMTNFSTYAVLTPDGEWHEPGRMGWWGISSATPEEEIKFSNQYEEKFLKNANPEWTLTIVDCHI